MNVKKEINWDIVEMYVKSGCTQASICKYFHIDDDTLRYRVLDKYGVTWAVFSGSLRSEGDMLIEAKQFEKAMKGYWPALQWLGKVRLGQKEPETNAQPVNQVQIDQSHIIMQLKHELARREENDNESKTE